MSKKLLRALCLCLCALMLLPLASCSHEHTFGEWKYDGETHSRQCTVKDCPETESGEHSYDGGVIAVEPDVDSCGEIKYTCSVCGQSYTESVDKLYKVTLKTFETYDIHTSLQKKYLADKPENATTYAHGDKELSYPVTFTFNWDVEGFNDDIKLDHYEFLLSENADMSDAKTFTTRFNDFSKSNGGLNLKVRTQYYWQVKTYFVGGKTALSDVATFKTLEGPRNIYVDGVANFRDLGGKDCEGGVLRQDLIFRCGRLHDNYATTKKVTTLGIKTLTAMGIKSEIDLRGKIKDGVVENGDKADGSFKVTSSVIGPEVNYFHCGAEYSDAMLGTNVGKTMVKETFAVLANKDNYPLLFHCSIGTDRTGIIAILTEGVCGVDEQVIIQDYLFSNFGNIGSERVIDRYNKVVAAIKACKGSTFQQKCAAYLLSCGVTQAQIDSVKDILIEKK